MIYNFCLCANNNYAMQTGVTIFSILCNIDNDVKTNFYILNEDFSDEVKRFFSKMEAQYNTSIVYVKYKFALEQIKNAKFLRKKIPNQAKKYFESMGLDAYARLFISQCLPDNVESVLYLDSDIIVDGDILSIFDYKSDEAISAVIDSWPQSYNKKIGLTSDSLYFSAGVQLLNLSIWRNNNLSQRVVDFINSMENHYRLFDQDIMNILFSAEILKLPLIYNEMYITRYFTSNQIMDFTQKDEKHFYSKKEIKESYSSRVIIHFAGDRLGKPWFYPYADNDTKIWMKYFNKSVWSKYKIYKWLNIEKKHYYKNIIKKSIKKIFYIIMGKKWLYKKVKNSFYDDIEKIKNINVE